MGAPPVCFAAVPLSPTVAVRQLQARLPEALRPIHRGDLHLTIAYFGRIPIDLHTPLVEAIGAVDFGGVDVVLEAVLPLPARDRPSALTLTLADGPARDAVVALMKQLRPRLAAIAGVPSETRGPLPHVTFARPRGRHLTQAKAEAILEWADSVEPIRASVTLGSVVLMRSHPPGGRGPHYEVVAAVPPTPARR